MNVLPHPVKCDVGRKLVYTTVKSHPYQVTSTKFYFYYVMFLQIIITSYRNSNEISVAEILNFPIDVSDLSSSGSEYDPGLSFSNGDNITDSEMMSTDDTGELNASPQPAPTTSTTLINTPSYTVSPSTSSIVLNQPCDIVNQL
ncbi:Uncharacterised protein at_DN2063 [Pycnogonum litorale]